MSQSVLNQDEVAQHEPAPRGLISWVKERCIPSGMELLLRFLSRRAGGQATGTNRGQPLSGEGQCVFRCLKKSAACDNPQQVVQKWGPTTITWIPSISFTKAHHETRVKAVSDLGIFQTDPSTHESKKHLLHAVDRGAYLGWQSGTESTSLTCHVA